MFAVAGINLPCNSICRLAKPTETPFPLWQSKVLNGKDMPEEKGGVRNRIGLTSKCN